MRINELNICANHIILSDLDPSLPETKLENIFLNVTLATKKLNSSALLEVKQL